MVNEQSLSVLVLTEDTGSGAHDVLVALLRKLFYLLDPQIDLSLVSFERGPRFNDFYKGTRVRDYDRQLNVAKVIANSLLGGAKPTIVVVHVDADRGWSDRCGEHGCDNLQAFRRRITARVAALLDGKGMVTHLDRLLEVIPFWCIESWLFQNSQEAQKICDELGNVAASEQITAWQNAPHRLDDVVRPKTQITLGAKYNLRVTPSFEPVGWTGFVPDWRRGLVEARS